MHEHKSWHINECEVLAIISSFTLISNTHSLPTSSQNSTQSTVKTLVKNRLHAFRRSHKMIRMQRNT